MRRIFRGNSSKALATQIHTDLHGIFFSFSFVATAFHFTTKFMALPVLTFCPGAGSCETTIEAGDIAAGDVAGGNVEVEDVVAGDIGTGVVAEAGVSAAG